MPVECPACRSTEIYEIERSARVCGACGHASLFADLEQLKELVAGGHIRKLRQP